MSIKPWPYNNNRGSSQPYVKGSATSKAAADSMNGIAKSKERQVLYLFMTDRSVGYTDDDLERILDEKHQTVSARRRSLEKRGILYKTEELRKTRSGRAARVYKVIESLTDDQIEDRMKSKPMGRPKSDNPRESRITVCFTDAQAKAIERVAADEDLFVAALVRKIVTSDPRIQMLMRYGS